MTDTDSLLYYLEDANFQEKMKIISKNYCDTSKFPSSDVNYSKQNEGRVGFFKDEVYQYNQDKAPYGETISEFIGLRSKMYMYTTSNNNFDVRAKGVDKSKHSTLKKENYLKTLLGVTDEKSNSFTCQRIMIKNKQLVTLETTKAALSWNDDKRYICNDRISTRALGHYKNL